MRIKGKQLRLIVCIALAVMMVASAFAAGNWYFSARALTEAEAGLESEYTPENGEHSANGVLSDAPAPIADDTMEVGGICYALFYSNGDLVFQLTNEADPERGTLKNTYTVNTSTTYSASSSSLPWYNNRASVKKVVFADVIRPEKMAYWFYGMTNLTEFENMENLDTSGVTSLYDTFYNCSKLTELDVSGWNTEQVTTLYYTFYGCSGLTELDVSGWNTEQVTTLYYTFYGCSGLTELDLSSWDVSNVTTMYNTFYNCAALTKLNVSNWNIEKVTSLHYTFYNCSNLSELDLSGWDIAAVTDMDYMFSNTVTKITLGEKFQFIGTKALTPSYWRNEDTNTRYFHTDLYNDYNEAPTDMAGTYIYDGTAPGGRCYAFLYDNGDLEFREFDAPKANGRTLVTSYALNMSTSYTSGATSLPWYNYRSDVKKVIFADKIAPVSMSNWFYYMENLAEFKGMENLDTSVLTNLESTFWYCKSLTELDVSGWNTEKVTNLQSTFSNCSSLTELDVSGWNTEKVTSLQSTFSSCSSLAELDVSGWNTEKVTSLQSTFSGCSGLTDLDVNGWDVSKVTKMSSTFSGCARLRELDISKWNNAKATDTGSMFSYGLRKLILGENFKFVGTNAFTATYWLSEKTGTRYSNTELCKAYDGSTMAGAYIYDGMGVGGYCYALLYENGDLVFQNDYLPKDDGVDRGELVGSWERNTSIDPSTPNDGSGNPDRTSVGWHPYRSSVKKVIFADEIIPINMDIWFSTMSNLTEVENGSNLNTSALTSMDCTFYSCTNLRWIDTSEWDLSKVTTMHRAFRSCQNLLSLDGENWKLSKVTNLYEAFAYCQSLTSLNSKNWDLSSVTSLYYTFQNCYKLTGLETDNWNLSNLTTLAYTFIGCRSLTTLNTANWDLSNVTSLESTFSGCSSLTNLDTSKWVLPKMGTLSYQNPLQNTFYGCSSLTALDISNLDLTNVKSLYSTFKGCSSLTTLYMGDLDLHTISNMGGTFQDCSSLKTLDTSKWNLSKVTGTGSSDSQPAGFEYTFSGCSSLTELDTRNWGLHASSLKHSFDGCSSLKTIDVSRWDMSRTTTLYCTFQDCSSLTELDMSSWDVSKVTTLYSTFYGCSSLTSLDLNDWNTESLTNVAYTFADCTNLTELNFKDWNVSKVTSISEMIRGCEKLTRLDISGWDTSKASNSNYSYADAHIESKNKVISYLLEIKLGPNSNMNAKNLFDFGSSENARWVKEGTDTPMSVTQMHTQRRSEKSAEAETWYRVRTVTFDANGGIAAPSSIGEWWPGKDIGELPTATRRGADFDGWWTEIVGGELLPEGVNPTQDIYYAHWIEHKYTLILDSNNGTHETISMVLEYSESYKLSSTIFTDPRSVITAWHSRPAGTGTYGANEEIIALTEEDNGEVRLYAQWTSIENIVTITFDSQGGTEVPSRQIERGTAIGGTGKLPVPVRAGFSFAGWYIQNEDGTLGDKADENTVVNGDITLVAEWKSNLVVQFNYNNLGLNSTVITRTVAYGDRIGTLPTDIYNGRYQAFIGWFTDPEDGEQIDADRVITRDETFYAHWGWRPRFNANGGKFNNPNYLDDYSITGESEYLIEKFPEVEYDGYRLVGWYHGDTQIKEGDTVDLSKSTEIYAVWERSNTIKITLLANGGTMKRADENATYETLIYEVYAGKRVAELPIPTRAGYEFLGWADLTQQIPDEYCDRNSVFNQNATLIACWIKQDCKVTFDRVEADARFYNTSAATKIINVPNGWTVNSLPGCTRTESGYMLEGWYTEKDGNGTKLTTETIITGDITYYAHWIPFATIGTTQLHQYTFGAEWTNANNANADNVGNNLEFHPQDNTTQVAQLHVSFELNNSYGEGGALPTGSVYIKIPKYVFFDKNKKNIGECNLTTWLVEYGKETTDKFSYMDGGDCYYLVNNQPLDTGGITITIEYSVKPNELEGGAVNEDGRYVDGYKYFKNDIVIEFGIDEDPGDPKNPKPWLDPESQETKELSLEMHTHVDTTATKSFSSFVYEWNEKTWGKKPADADDYFYIIWNLTESYKSYTNQPSKFEWSEEETVHDGTIVYISSGESGSHNGNGSRAYTCTVVTKHPRELLDNVPSIGRTFYNEAIVTETWDSAYITQHRVNASATIYPDDYGRGEFDKDRYYSKYLISGGQEDVLDDLKEIEMPWSIWYDGGSNVRPTWDEETKTYYAPNRTIRITDGVRGDLLYSSGRASSKYIWKPNTGNFDLNDDDYYFYSLRISLTEYDAISENDVWSEKTAVTDVSKYEPIEIWVRYKDTNSFVFYQSIKYTGATTVSLPENVVGFQVFHTSDFYWTYISIKADMRLVPTQKIYTWVQSDVDARTTSIIKNIAHCDIWLTEEGEESTFFEATNRGGDYSSALDDLYELNISSTYQYTEKFADTVRIDAGTHSEDVPMLIRGYNYNPSGRMKKLKSGAFYDLLPTGTSVDPNTVICIPETSHGSVDVSDYDSYVNSSNKLDPAMFDVRFVQDWEGSGRTMMIIKFVIPENKYPSIAVLYMLHNTYEGLRLSGLTTTNDVAFVNTSEGRVWPDGLSGHINDLPMDDQGFYEDLLIHNEGFISFAQASANFKDPEVQTWGFDKRVMTSDEYKVSDTTFPGKTYTYRLSYSQSSTTYSKNMVLYDVLEQSARRRDDKGNPTDPILSAWQGTLVSVDVVPDFKTNQASDLKYVIYYSTVDRDKFNLEPVTNPAEYDLCDLSNSDYWSTEMPEDKSSVTAIAVDFSQNTDNGDFTMSGEGSLDVYITMLAPEDATDIEGKTAYNEGVFYSQQGEKITPLYSDAQVLLRDLNPGLDKISDPESGTKDEPTLLTYNQEITYTLKVTNTDDSLYMYDVVVEDEVPKGLYIITGEIMVHFGDKDNALTVEESKRINMDKVDQKLTFTISSLRPKETMRIEIPVVVSVTSAVFENSAEITSVDGIEKSIRSQPNYHEVVPTVDTELQIEKKLTGRADPIEEGEFTFIAELIAIDGEAVTAEETELNTYTGATSGASGWVSLGPIHFDAEAEGHIYKYKITEVAGTDKHIKYSSDAIYALIEIVDKNPEDELNAYLVANRTYYTDEECTEQIELAIPTVENKFFDGADMEITKVIDGEERRIEAGEFTFIAVEVDNDTLAPVPDGRSYNGSTTGEDGRVTFEPIPYSADDAGKTYTFKITENEGDEEGIIYSEEIIYAKLTVTLEEDNSLSYTVTYFTVSDGNVRSELDNPTITNFYSAYTTVLFPDLGGTGVITLMIGGLLIVLLAACIVYAATQRKKKHN